MITATIKTRKKVKGVLTERREIELFDSVEKARKYLKPIAVDMAICKQLKKTPEVEIVGVSWDFESEKNMLVEIKAYETTDKKSQDA